MPRGSAERTAAREEEIINACEKLYQTMNFKEITLKEISAVTAYTRTSIYHYFQTKEEIFLALFAREYDLWTADLEEIANLKGTRDQEMLAGALATSLQKRTLMLKLLSVNLYDMEENSRMERLTAFKTSYGKSCDTLRSLMRSWYPGISEEDLQSFMLSFLPLLHGVYPYAHATEKQIEAMNNAGVSYVKWSIYRLVYQSLLKLLP